MEKAPDEQLTPATEIKTTNILREFSKEHSQEERDKLAREIKEARKERHGQLAEAQEMKETIEKNLANLEKNSAELSHELASISDTFYSRLVDFLKIKKIRKQLDSMEGDKVEAKIQQSAADSTVNSLSRSKENTPLEFADSKKAIEKFYKEQEEKWSKLPYESTEIFIAYPSYVMAANYFHRRDPHVRDGSSNYNDIWVYVEEDNEMNINAGITFIPKNAQVNPETGSKYEIDTQGEAAPDEAYIAKIQDMVTKPGFEAFAEKASKALGDMPGSFVEEYMQGNLVFGGEKNFAIIKGLIDELKQIIPDIDKEMLTVVMDYNFLDASEIQDRKNIQNRLIDLGIYYKKTSATVSSQEYWENYFSKNPSKRPSKIVYYDGNDPTKALDDWKGQNGLDNKKPVELTDKRIMEKSNSDISEQITDEMARFRSLAEKVIDDYYANKSEEVLSI